MPQIEFFFTRVKLTGLFLWSSQMEFWLLRTNKVGFSNKQGNIEFEVGFNFVGWINLKLNF